MFRLWGKEFKDNHMIKDTTICDDSDDTRTHKIFNALDDLDTNLTNASRDLGATEFQTFWKITFPLSLNGVRSGVQAVFIPSLSLFMLTRLIGGNRVITLGTAIEQHFLTTQNWGMGSTIGVILIIAMATIMWMTKERSK